MDILTQEDISVSTFSTPLIQLRTQRPKEIKLGALGLRKYSWDL